MPLTLYSSLLQPILSILLPHNGSELPTNDPADSLGDLSLQDKHGFFNISITPLECSIVCHQSWVDAIFVPAIRSLLPAAQKQISISKDAYEVFSVSAAGMEAGSRVMELTAPLALAGVPIFFITTYWADFIMVPAKDHKVVVETLEAKGFEFSDIDGGYVVPTPISHTRGNSSLSMSMPPSTPPPSNVGELQKRTFAQLKKRNVVPFVVPGLQLVQCSGKDMVSSGLSRPGSNGGNGPFSGKPHWLDGLDTRLYLALISTLISQPRFLSLTLSSDDTPSLLVDKALLGIFGDSIVGDTDGFMIPIFLDLSNLPVESTGIVCGVAGTLVEDMRMSGLAKDLSYLSTAKAGAVMLGPEGSARALEVLLPLLQTEE